MIPTRQIRVAVIDDHPLIRRGVRDALSDRPAIDVVGEGASAEDAVTIADTLHPDVMLVDINMPGDGVEAARRICSKHPNVGVVMLTVYDNMANVQGALQAGAAGYVIKGVDGEELATIVEKVARGEKHISPELAVKLLSQADDADDRAELERDGLAMQSTLTDRERQIHKLIGRGASNLEIARELDLKEATIKHYASQLFRKLGVKNRTEAALLLK